MEKSDGHNGLGEARSELLTVMQTIENALYSVKYGLSDVNKASTNVETMKLTYSKIPDLVQSYTKNIDKSEMKKYNKLYRKCGKDLKKIMSKPNIFLRKMDDMGEADIMDHREKKLSIYEEGWGGLKALLLHVSGISEDEIGVSIKKESYEEDEYENDDEPEHEINQERPVGLDDLKKIHKKIEDGMRNGSISIGDAYGLYKRASELSEKIGAPDYVLESLIKVTSYLDGKQKEKIITREDSVWDDLKSGTENIRIFSDKEEN